MLSVGSLASVVLASIWRWQGLDYARPGGLALGGLQGAVGGLLTFWACEKWATVRVAQIWLAAFLLLIGLAMLVLGVIDIWMHRIDLLLSWKLGSSLAYLTAIFFVRRSMLDSSA
ncbi:hypothetical protein EAH84_05305 [Sphingomonas oligophenolica]|uniref:Uncharacterized protein n=1 Tax=Sphingomonas oligophenolica TaxID=301154 RepID=A0A502CLA2_9SPHN|nr:hypothetical protein EAH84_05305 [Sphingomonas oligophenolica]